MAALPILVAQPKHQGCAAKTRLCFPILLPFLFRSRADTSFLSIASHGDDVDEAEAVFKTKGTSAAVVALHQSRAKEQDHEPQDTSETSTDPSTSTEEEEDATSPGEKTEEESTDDDDDTNSELRCEPLRDDDSTISEYSTKPRAVQFRSTTLVVEIPSFKDYPEEIQQDLRMTVDEIAEIVERNRYEYRAEGGRADLVLEEHHFFRDETGELVHPETWRRQRESEEEEEEEETEEAGEQPPPPIQEVVFQQQYYSHISHEPSHEQPKPQTNDHQDAMEDNHRREQQPERRGSSPRQQQQQRNRPLKKRPKVRRVAPAVSGESTSRKGRISRRNTGRIRHKQHHQLIQRINAPSLTRFADT